MTELFKLPEWLFFAGGIVSGLIITGTCELAFFYLNLPWYIVVFIASVMLLLSWWIGLTSLLITLISFGVIAFSILIFCILYTRQDIPVSRDQVDDKKAKEKTGEA